MGLCKCPKSNVTNLFCFEHRVNVCEFCLVDNHSKCVVQSYLKWLEDGDYNPVCPLCNYKLVEGGPVIRLLCYHVFHWQCLRNLYASFPQNTAPAGFNCPQCGESLFPPANQSGPVAEALRSELATEKWAREGLGLPLLEVECNDVHPQVSSVEIASPEVYGPFERLDSNDNPEKLVDIVTHHPAFMPTNQVSAPVETSHREKISERRNYSVPEKPSISTAKYLDSDENKYARKSIFTLISNLLKAHQIDTRISSKLPNRKMARFGMYAFFIAIFLFTVIAVLQGLSRRLNVDDDLDPLFNPRLNPNIRIERGVVEHLPGVN